jgi:hypothetical protein
MKLPRDVREERVQTVVAEMCNRGVMATKRMLMKRWKIAESTWSTYMDSAYAEMRANRAANLEDCRANAIARLNKIIATDRGQVRVAALRELHKIEGVYAPVTTVVTNLTPNDALPAAVEALLSDPEALAREIALDAKHLGKVQPEAKHLGKV